MYRAWDTKLERVVAIKVLPSDPGESSLPRRRSEASLLASLNHASLVTLYDAIVTPDATYLVMEFLGGGTLQARIRQGPMGADTVAAVAGDLATALAYIHARGIVHRDVKPGNVLLAADEDPGRPPAAKLTDFGIAKLLETSAATTTGVLGTAHYLSPEQARGGPVGPASDVYSLGLTLIEAATGRAVFPGTAVESLTARLLRDPEVPGFLGYGWRSLLTAMTGREAGDRPSAEEVAARARDLAAQAFDDDRRRPSVTAPLPQTAPTATFSASSPPVRTSPRHPRRLVTAAGGVGLVLAAAIAVSFTVSGVPPVAGTAPAAVSGSTQTPPTSPAPSPAAATPASAAPSVARTPEPISAGGTAAGTANGASTSPGSTRTTKQKTGTSVPKGKKASNGKAEGHGKGDKG